MASLIESSILSGRPTQEAKMKCGICGTNLDHWSFLYEERDIRPPEEGVYCVECIERYPEKTKKMDEFFYELMRKFMEREGR